MRYILFLAENGALAPSKFPFSAKRSVLRIKSLPSERTGALKCKNCVMVLFSGTRNRNRLQLVRSDISMRFKVVEMYLSKRFSMGLLRFLCFAMVLCMATGCLYEMPADDYLQTTPVTNNPNIIKGNGAESLTPGVSY